MVAKWKRWEQLLEVLDSKKRLLLLLDFDGTLAPIERFPHQVRLSVRTRDVLRRLIKYKQVSIAVISGRSLKDIQKKVALRGAYYVGNHGLEAQGPGIKFKHARLGRQPRLINLAARYMRHMFKDTPGVYVENKRLSISIHYRNVKTRDLSAFHSMLKKALAINANLPLEWHLGLKVCEITPAIEWNKGKAALWLMKKKNNPFPIAIGDDTTDEAMFRMLKNKGLTVCVGAKLSAAQYHFKNPSEVHKFLSQMEKKLSGISKFDMNMPTASRRR